MTTEAPPSTLALTTQPSDLATALSAVIRAVSPRPTLPILGHVLLEATDDGLRLTATNLEIGIRKVVPAEVTATGAITVPARLLSDFVAELPDKPLVLEDHADGLTLACGPFTTRISAGAASDFPPGPQPDDGDRLTLPLTDLLRAIEQTAGAAATDDSRPVMTGVLFEIEGRKLRLVATDGHRLAVREVSLPTSDVMAARLIVPARALAELARTFKGHSGEVEILVSAARNQAFFRCGTSEVSTRLIDGTYPNYAQAIPPKHQTVVKVPAANLARTVKAVSVFAKDSAQVVKLSAGDGTLTLSSNTSEIGDSTASMDADTEGPGIEIAFNARYLLDALALVGDTAEFHFDGPLSPCVLVAEGYRHVVMPVRVGGGR